MDAEFGKRLYVFINDLTQRGVGMPDFKEEMAKSFPEFVMMDEIGTQEIKFRIFDVYGDVVRVTATFVGSQKYAKENLKSVELLVAKEVAPAFQMLLGQGGQQNGTKITEDGTKITVNRISH